MILCANRDKVTICDKPLILLICLLLLFLNNCDTIYFDQCSNRLHILCMKKFGTEISVCTRMFCNFQGGHYADIYQGGYQGDIYFALE